LKDKPNELMSNLDYRLMVFYMAVADIFFPRIGKRVTGFGIQPGMTVVDYGCGPGRYTLHYSRLTGREGKVYAVDIHEMALEIVRKKISKYGLDNVHPVLAAGYASGLPDTAADLVTVIDLFFAIRDQKAFLAEVRRISKPDGVLIIDDGHQPRKATREQLAAAGSWFIVEETLDHLKCKAA
jgi:ubiquinone/menaquinone biosynthesis C-methylase UbiE